MTKKAISDFHSPGQALKYLLNYYDWTQDDLAHILTISLKHTNELIKDKKSISIDTARLLEKVFDWDAKQWIMLDTKYQLSKKVEKGKDGLVERQVEVYKYLPIKELLKKGWLKPYKDTKGLNKQLRNFWNIDKGKQLDFSVLSSNKIKIEFRKSDAYKNSPSEINARAWYQMAHNHAINQKVEKFDKKKLKELMPDLHKFTYMSNGISKFLNELGKVGVRFVFLSHLSKTYLDGAAFSTSKGPVVTLTGRYDRVDNFWFTLCHEIFHIILHLDSKSNSSMVFMDDSTSAIHTKKEKEANEMAEKTLLQDQILVFFEEYLGYITEEKVKEFSKSHKIHPSIVVGILAFNGKVSYSTLHRFKETVRDKIPNKYKAEL